MKIYYIIKIIHISLIITTITNFIIRGLTLIQEKKITNKNILNKLTHFVDSLILITGIILIIITNQYPQNSKWITVKIITILTYIIFGSICMKSKTQKYKKIFFFISIFNFCIIIIIAKFKYFIFS